MLARAIPNSPFTLTGGSRLCALDRGIIIQMDQMVAILDEVLSVRTSATRRVP
jgi:hypothetical protein